MNQNGQTASDTNHTQRKLLTAGIFKARPEKGALIEKDGVNGKFYQYGVQFLLLEGPDAGKRISWWGGFKGGGIQFTTNTLKILGWDEKVPLEDWQPKNEVMLVLEHDTIPAVPASPKNPNGKPAQQITRVKYVNSLDGSGAGSGIEKLALKGDKLKNASATVMALISANKSQTEGAGSTDSGSGNADAPNSFDTSGGAGEGGDDLPF